LTPTLIELSVGSLETQRSFTLRVRPTPSTSTALPLDDLVKGVGARG
jgi:hypothetical protein